jgi:DNA-binding transcriptional regulator YiaG
MPPKKKPREAYVRVHPDLWMTPTAFEKAIAKLGFSQSAFARQIAVNDRTVRSWINGRFPVPRVVAQLVNLMIETEATAENLKP